MIRKILANAGWASASMPFNAAAGIVQTGLMARMLGPEGLGAIALYAAACALVGGFCKLNSSQAALTYVTQAVAAGEKARAAHIVRYCYGLDLLTGLFACAVLAALAFCAPLALDLKPEQAALLAAYGLTLACQSTYWTSHALLRVADKFAWTFYQSIAQSLLKLAAVAALFLAGAGLAEAVWMLVGMSLFNGLSLHLMARAALRRAGVPAAARDPSLGRWWRAPAEIRRFQTFGYGSGAMKTLYRYLDVVLVGLAGDAAAVGIYRAAAQFAGLLDFPVQAMIAGMSPEYSRLWFAGEKKQLQRLVLQSSALLVGAMGAALAVFIPLSGQIILLVYGEAFAGGRDTFAILVFASLLSALMVPLNTVQTASGQGGPAAASAAATALVQGALLLWLVPTHGIAGAAWARVAALAAALAIMIPTGVRRLARCPGAPKAGQNLTTQRTNA